MSKTGLVLAPSLLGLLALALPADEVAFHPKADLELKKELKVTAEFKQEKVTATVNGEPAPPDSFGDLGDKPAIVKLAVDATDKYVQTKEGRPTELLRTFDSLRLSAEAGGEAHDAPSFDALEGKTVRFKWNADSESYEKSLVDSKGDDALLAQLSDDFDLRVLLPAKKVTEGETWEVTGDRLLPFFLPGGVAGEIASGSDKEEIASAITEVRAALGKFQEDMKVVCKYKGARDEGGERVGVIDFTFANKGKPDLSRLIQTIAAAEETDIHFDVDASADIDLQGSGTLLWNLAGGRVQSFAMHSEAGVDLDVKMEFAVESQNVEALVKARFACKADWSLTATKP